jgi:hypothetical protein
MNEEPDDNKNYYNRVGRTKKELIFEYVRDLEYINKVYDVGCNNGDMSYGLQKNLNLDVLGTDFSSDLNLPSDYKFIHKNIVDSNDIYFNDVTLFLSLYHHILGKYGLQAADKVFLKLLLRTNYLIFDTGNLSEHDKKGQYWYKEQASYFSSEDDLLNHFNIPYEILGTWKCGGGSRKVVVFKNNKKTFDSIVDCDKFITRNFSNNQQIGLIPLEASIDSIASDSTTKPTLYQKVSYLNMVLFCKKRISPEYYGKNYILKELNNIELVYKNINSKKLIEFYGFNENYGLMYKWEDDLKYKTKTELVVGDGLTLRDVDVVIDRFGNTKYIDFER